jgi:acyl carrier protein
MDPEAILSLMKAFFEGKQPPEVLEAFPERKIQDLLKESLDIVDFIVYLEEELGRDIDTTRLGTALLNKNFGELSVEVSRMLAEEGYGAEGLETPR